MQPGKNSIYSIIILAGVSISLLCSCSNKDNKGAQQGAKVLPYKVINLSHTSTTLYTEYPAKIQGILDIDIRPKIDGYIEKVWVDEGQNVRKGQTLFTINNPQFAQDVNNMQAAIASAEAALATAQLQYNKTKPLVDQGIISNYELESAQFNVKAKQAALEQARAGYNNARINLGYTNITSPANGVVGTIPYRIGSYVNSTTQQPLTTVSDISHVYAYFALNEKQQLSFLEQSGGGAGFQDRIKALPPIDLILSTGEVYTEKGRVETFSGQVDAQTGSFNVRARFPNAQHLIRSGSNVTVRIPTAVNDAILIPQFATTELQNKRLAYIVGDSNKVKAVPVAVRPVPGGKYFVVDSGLSTSDKLIVEGIGIITEGTVIEPALISSDSLMSSK